MLSKFFAIVLVSLIVSPFTAPFSTCDFSMVVSRQMRHSVSPARTIRRLESDTSVTTPVPPLARGIGRVRSVVLARVRAVSPTADLATRAMDARAVKPPNDRTASLTALRV